MKICVFAYILFLCYIAFGKEEIMIEVKEYLTRNDMEELDKSMDLVPITFDYLFKSLFTDNLDILRKFILTQIDEKIVPEECKITLLNSELPI